MSKHDNDMETIAYLTEALQTFETSFTACFKSGNLKEELLKKCEATRNETHAILNGLKERLKNY